MDTKATEHPFARSERRRRIVNRMVRTLRSKYDVEYVGGVGFCGPGWQAAQAEWDAFYADFREQI